MDERLKKAMEFSNYQKTFQIKKDTLRLRLNNKIIFKYNNNIIKITKETISFLSLYPSTSCIIEDINGIPVLIKSPKDIYLKMLEIYNSAYSEFLEEYDKIKIARNIKKIVSYNE